MTKASEIQAAFDKFMADEKRVQDAILSATEAGHGSSGYSVELFPDGRSRVLWNNQIGNMYSSPGVIIGIPQLSSDEIDAEAGEYFFDNAIEALREKAEDIIGELDAE